METPTPFESDNLSGRIIGAAIEVHKTVGPGLIESIYENALCHELSLQNLNFQRQIGIDVCYKGQIVEKEIVLELGSVSRVHEVVFAQLLSYLKFTGLNSA